MATNGFRTSATSDGGLGEFWWGGNGSAAAFRCRRDFRFSEILLTLPPNQVSDPPRSVPAGGAYASSRDAGRDAVAATASSGRAMSTGLVQRYDGLPAESGCEVFRGR